MSDEFRPKDLPSTDNGPRETAEWQQTGFGTPRSANDGLQEPGALGDREADIDPAIAVGATTGSHPAAAHGVDINRSGSGGTGGPGTPDDVGNASEPSSMPEMLGGTPEEGSRH